MLYVRGPEAAAQQVRRGGQLELSEEGEEQMTEKKGWWSRWRSSGLFICGQSGEAAPTPIGRG
jgi:hypothetical protein